jgi:hypothetical protein
MDYEIAVPSYKRSDVLVNRTLKTLGRMVDLKKRLTVFVADKEEETIYRNAIGKDYKIVVGKKGIIHQRRFLSSYYPKNTKLLCVDDDLFDLELLHNGKLVPFTGDLDEVVAHGFDVCRKFGAKHWGIAAFENAFYMRPYTSVGLRYICGIFHGCFAGDSVMCGDDRLLVSSNEDFETTVRSFMKYGSVVRLDWLCPKTKYFAAGGIRAEIGGDAEDRKADHAKAVDDCARRYKGLCTAYTKATGDRNIKLKTLPHQKVLPPKHLLAA